MINNFCFEKKYPGHENIDMMYNKTAYEHFTGIGKIFHQGKVCHDCQHKHSWDEFHFPKNYHHVSGFGNGWKAVHPEESKLPLQDQKIVEQAKRALRKVGKIYGVDCRLILI